jgi:heat-inducible transcriptional repressor
VKSKKTVPAKRSNKRKRERRVLLGLVEQYLANGKPVGSKSLQSAGFHDLSSATIRNYFARLEDEGYLVQLHASGGRIPTHLAYREYVDEYYSASEISDENRKLIDTIETDQSHEIHHFLEHSAEQLSHLTKTAVFLSMPRFDHDFIISLKLVEIDTYRSLCIMLTDFGMIKTEVLHSPKKLSKEALLEMESFFQGKLHGESPTLNLLPEELHLAETFYNEVMLRYIIGYSNFSQEQISCKGFSQLLHYPDFTEIAELSHSLAILEDENKIRRLLRETCKKNDLKTWVAYGDNDETGVTPDSSIITIPYHIQQNPVGAIGILGPLRIPYRELFGILRYFSSVLSKTLTHKIYTYKINYRQPKMESLKLETSSYGLVADSQRILLEDQT